MPPKISVLVLTYKRIALLTQTVKALRANLGYSNYEVIVCDDCSPVTLQAEMRRLPIDRFVSGERNSGLGANSNRGVAAATGDFILQVQDDWIFHRTDRLIERAVEALNQFPDIAMIRFYEIEKFPEYSTRTLRDGTPLRVVIPTPANLAVSRFFYSDTPHLKRRSFHNQMGRYLEGCRMEVTETDFAQRFLNSSDCAVAYFPSGVGRFEHIGEEESFRTRHFKYRLHRFLSRNRLGRGALAAQRRLRALFGYRFE